MSQQVMTITELATYLDIAESTLYKKVQAHDIPFAKVGNALRFTKVTIDAWLARNTVQPGWRSPRRGRQLIVKPIQKNQQKPVKPTQTAYETSRASSVAGDKTFM